MLTDPILKAHLAGQVREGKYLYTTHLRTLDSCRPLTSGSPLLSSSKQSSHSPLQIETWSQELDTHPDKDYVSYIIEGMSDGFRIGFNRKCRLQPPPVSTMTKNKPVISEYLHREVTLGRMQEHVLPPGNQIHISSIGAIPKRNKPGKWRLIVDLSSPAGASINDGISPELSSISYVSVDHLSSLVLSVGKGAFLVKADIKEAYRMLPIHPHDQFLLGVQWEGTVYTDRALPSGLRSALKIFSAVADALHWILVQKGVNNLLHYLDDFIFVAESLDEAKKNMQILVTTFASLGVPLETSKLEGPARCLTFLGIELDTVTLQLRLPNDKLQCLKEALASAESKKCMSKQNLQSLTGLLQHAVKVVRPGRPFLHRLYALQQVGTCPSHHIRLNAAARGDIIWWHVFIDKWNGISLAWDLGYHLPEIIVYSDASGSWGCGGYVGKDWFQYGWSVHHQDMSIASKELIPVVISAAIFGRRWSGKLVNFMVDNLAVVQVLQATYSRNTHLMHLIRLLVLFVAHFNFWFTATHVMGKKNTFADALSRNNASLFLSQLPHVNHQPTAIPPQLPGLLVQSITWTCTSWIQQLDCIFRQL